MRLNSNLARACVMDLTTPSRRFCDLGVVVLLVVSDEAVGKSRRSHLSNPVQQDENKKARHNRTLFGCQNPLVENTRNLTSSATSSASPFTVIIKNDLQPGQGTSDMRRRSSGRTCWV